MSQRDKDVTFFVVWVLNKAAKRWGTTPSEVYRRLEAAGIVSGYLVGFYDTVHTMGEHAILDDLSQLATTRGVAL